MIELIEENPKAQRFKSYITVFAILFITFAIPVTITQYYRGSQLTSSANVVTPTRNINSYIITMTSAISSSPTATPTLTLTPSVKVSSSPIVTPLLFISATPTTDKSSISSFVSDYMTPYILYYALILGLLVVWLILIIYYFAVKKKSLSLTDQEKLPQ